ncbi:hypothetical protein IHE45_09G028900 [Dioscorea alata]|uniref:Uncharacterized protein n=1 Tax=Dioscorea alata TaxID=55571 RepID=A0ACB7VDU7_DIOAL|nr:hypothetical protein IHE45_09G028900 [Dioscorea alata]
MSEQIGLEAAEDVERGTTSTVQILGSAWWSRRTATIGVLSTRPTGQLTLAAPSSSKALTTSRLQFSIA